MLGSIFRLGRIRTALSICRGHIKTHIDLSLKFRVFGYHSEATSCNGAAVVASPVEGNDHFSCYVCHVPRDPSSAKPVPPAQEVFFGLVNCDGVLIFAVLK